MVARMVFEVDEDEANVKMILRRNINMMLQSSRKKNNFIPSEEQQEAYNKIHRRGGKQFTL
jgi:hypothetical protein